MNNGIKSDSTNGKKCGKGVMARFSTILLLGPTGCGKTPLGGYFQSHGLQGKKCFHFDFGEQLRAIAELKNAPHPLSTKDIDYIRTVLREGALLENETFYIAETIFNLFIARYAVTVDDVILLNGIPRHEGQAGAVGTLVDIRMVVYLACTADVVRMRIRNNSGGDRAERVDDSLEAIERRLTVFTGRTMPLIQYYRQRDIPVVTIPVGIDTTPQQIAAMMNGK